MKITSLDKNIKDLLGGSFFYIPRFQRPYAWDRENLEEFWTDTITNSDADYFIGSIVTYTHNDARAIVDGQQRITTILLILSAVRDAFKRESFEERAQGIQNLIERKDIDDNTDRFVLKTETSYPFLQDRILRYGSPELDLKAIAEEKTLRDAFDFFKDKINKLIDSIDSDTTLNSKKRGQKKDAELSRIRNKILALRTISVELDSEDDAYIIFETLNTRGKDLTAGQLAKNLFARILKPKNRHLDQVSRKWTQIQEKLETSSADISLESYLLHYWISKYEYINLKRLYKGMKQLINKDSASGILDSLVSDATHYRVAFEPVYRAWKSDELEIRNSLEALNVMRIRQPAPLVLAILRSYDNKKLSKKNTVAGLSAIEHFHFTYTAMSNKTSSGGMSMMYGSLAQRISNSPDPNPVVAELRKKLRERWPEYAEFVAGFKELKFSNSVTKDKKLVKYVLAKLEREARGQNGPPIREEDQTIEHLEAQSNSGLVDDSHIAMIGNLCLVSKKLNETSLANKPTAQKAQILQKNGVVLLDDFLKMSGKWDNAAIDERTNTLANYAFNNVWTKP